MQSGRFHVCVLRAALSYLDLSQVYERTQRGFAVYICVSVWRVSVAMFVKGIFNLETCNITQIFSGNSINSCCLRKRRFLQKKRLAEKSKHSKQMSDAN